MSSDGEFAPGCRALPSGETIPRLAEYVVNNRGVRSSDLAREAALRCILDLLGAAAVGLVDDGVRATKAVALAAMQEGPIPIWFSGSASSAVGAAWVNSAAASALDLDDGHRIARGHPGAAVIPSALAVGQQIGASFEDILTAIVIGYEVGIGVAAARKVYGNTGTWSAFAAVAAIGALGAASQEQLGHAFAIAGELSPNQMFSSDASKVLVPEGSDVKEGIPWSVVTGFAALRMAEAGHTGPRNLLDWPGLYRPLLPLNATPSQQILGTYFKLYACCRHVHAPLDAVLRLVGQANVSWSEIESITVHTYGGALRISNKSDPANLVDVQYSIPYCIALALVDGPEALLPLTKTALGRPELVKLARRVSVALDPTLDDRFPSETLARVEVKTKAGVLMSGVTAPRGEASDPLRWEELELKFKTVTRAIATSDQQREVLSAFQKARAGDFGRLMGCLEGLTFSVDS